MERSRIYISKQDTERIQTVKNNPEAYCYALNNLIKLGFRLYSSDGFAYYPVMNVAAASVNGMMIVTSVKQNFQVHDIVHINHPIVVRFNSLTG